MTVMTDGKIHATKIPLYSPGDRVRVTFEGEINKWNQLALPGVHHAVCGADYLARATSIEVLTPLPPVHGVPFDETASSLSDSINYRRAMMAGDAQ